MRAFLRLCTMCLWLLVTSPLYWASTVACLYSAWRWNLPLADTLPLFAGCAAGSLLFTLLVEARGALCERVRFARSGGVVLSAAVSAVAVSALGWWALSAVLLRGFP